MTQSLLQVRTLPYNASTIDQRTTTVHLPGSNSTSANKCLAVASNEGLCSSNSKPLAVVTLTHNSPLACLCSVSYVVMGDRELELQTTYMDNTTQLMTVDISWSPPTSSALSVVLELTDSNKNSSVGVNCTTPGRYPPCFIIRDSVSMIMT